MKAKRGGRGLGKLLLKGFHRSKSKKSPQKKSLRAGAKSRVTRVRRLQLSRMQGKDKTFTPATEEELANRVASNSGRKGTLKKSEDIDAAPTVEATEVVTELTSASPPVELAPPPGATDTLPAASEATQVPAPVADSTQFISTREFLRPNDQLRQSIEAFLLDQRSPHTRKAYGKDLKRFVLFLHGRKQKQGIENINRTVLIAYKESLLNEGLEHTTVDRHIATLRSFFGWLVDDDIITKSPAAGVRFMNPKRLSSTRGFSDDEVRKILAIPDLHTRTGSQHYAILMVLFYCGLRRSEICELRSRNITMERNQYVFKLRGKGNKERLIVMIPAVWNAVKHYLLITGRDLMNDDNLFKPMRNNRTGVLKKGLDPSMIFYIVTRYAKLAGIAARVSPHSCRATAISNARDHQVPDRAIQEFAGWSSPDMITRYDKRKTSIENSAAHSITYGAEVRRMPEGPTLTVPSSSSKPDTATTEEAPELPAESK